MTHTGQVSGVESLLKVAGPTSVKIVECVCLAFAFRQNRVIYQAQFALLLLWPILYKMGVAEVLMPTGQPPVYMFAEASHGAFCASGEHVQIAMPLCFSEICF